jgi:very-short-patch-repair endonuclease
MKNIITINDKVVSDYYRGKSKNNPSHYLLVGGGKITKEQLIRSDIKIKCNGDGSFYSIKSITSAHLNKEYFGFKWRGIHKNPFKGRMHKKSFKKKLSLERRGVWGVGIKNPNFGKSNYQRWLEKYGKEKADELEAMRAAKMSIAMSGSNNPFFGKTHTNDVRDIITQKGKNWRNGLSEEYLKSQSEKISKSQKKLQQNNPEEYKKIKAKGGKASMMAQMKTWKPNKIESIVQTELNKRGLLFKFGVILGYKQFDFGNKKHKILLEVQGDYWHANPELFGEGKRPLNEIQMSKIEKDKEKEKFCQEKGFSLFHIWETQILNNDFSVLDEIQNKINN